MTPTDARRHSVHLDSLLAGSSLAAECLVEALRRHPLIALRLPFWRLRGKPFVRERLAQCAEVDPAALPYRAEALEELRSHANSGAHLVLVTTADRALAWKVAAHLGIGEVEEGRSPTERRGSIGWIARA